MNDTFSKRHGFYRQDHKDITIRTDAPYELRGVIVQVAYECGFRPRFLRSFICRVLRKREDENNWSEYPNIDNEVRELIDDCAWYRVYDIIEVVAKHMQEYPDEYEYEKFDSEINDYFIENGIGWKLIDARIEIRGAEVFEQSLHNAEIILREEGFPTARNELHEALSDLSRRPSPDVTGAIQHSMAALECVARVACGDEKATLGEIMKRYKGIIPKPLDEAINKLWGFASENARHITEGREPSFEEAELVVCIVAGVSNYLARKK